MTTWMDMLNDERILDLSQFRIPLDETAFSTIQNCVKDIRAAYQLANKARPWGLAKKPAYFYLAQQLAVQAQNETQPPLQRFLKAYIAGHYQGAKAIHLAAEIYNALPAKDVRTIQTGYSRKTLLLLTTDIAAHWVSCRYESKQIEAHIITLFHQFDKLLFSYPLIGKGKAKDKSTIPSQTKAFNNLRKLVKLTHSNHYTEIAMVDALAHATMLMHQHAIPTGLVSKALHATKSNSLTLVYETYQKLVKKCDKQTAHRLNVGFIHEICSYLQLLKSDGELIKRPKVIPSRRTNAEQCLQVVAENEALLNITIKQFRILLPFVYMQDAVLKDTQKSKTLQAELLKLVKADKKSIQLFIVKNTASQEYLLSYLLRHVPILYKQLEAEAADEISAVTQNARRDRYFSSQNDLATARSVQGQVAILRARGLNADGIKKAIRIKNLHGGAKHERNKYNIHNPALFAHELLLTTDFDDMIAAARLSMTLLGSISVLKLKKLMTRICTSISREYKFLTNLNSDHSSPALQISKSLKVLYRSMVILELFQYFTVEINKIKLPKNQIKIDLNRLLPFHLNHLEELTDAYRHCLIERAQLQVSFNTFMPDQPDTKQLCKKNPRIHGMLTALSSNHPSNLLAQELTKAFPRIQEKRAKKSAKRVRTAAYSTKIVITRTAARPLGQDILNLHQSMHTGQNFGAFSQVARLYFGTTLVQPFFGQAKSNAAKPIVPLTSSSEDVAVCENPFAHEHEIDAANYNFTTSADLYKLRVIKVPGDGDCFYHCICQQLIAIGFKPKGFDARQLRTLASTHLRGIEHFYTSTEDQFLLSQTKVDFHWAEGPNIQAVLHGLSEEFKDHRFEILVFNNDTACTVSRHILLAGPNAVHLRDDKEPIVFCIGNQLGWHFDSITKNTVIASEALKLKCIELGVDPNKLVFLPETPRVGAGAGDYNPPRSLEALSELPLFTNIKKRSSGTDTPEDRPAPLKRPRHLSIRRPVVDVKPQTHSNDLLLLVSGFLPKSKELDDKTFSANMTVLKKMLAEEEHTFKRPKSIIAINTLADLQHEIALTSRYKLIASEMAIEDANPSILFPWAEKHCYSSYELKQIKKEWERVQTLYISTQNLFLKDINKQIDCFKKVIKLCDEFNLRIFILEQGFQMKTVSSNELLSTGKSEQPKALWGILKLELSDKLAQLVECGKKIPAESLSGAGPTVNFECADNIKRLRDFIEETNVTLTNDFDETLSSAEMLKVLKELRQTIRQAQQLSDKMDSIYPALLAYRPIAPTGGAALLFGDMPESDQEAIFQGLFGDLGSNEEEMLQGLFDGADIQCPNQYKSNY